MKRDGELLPHLFRNEYSKIVAVLTRRFGWEQVEIAEDIASETFLTAAQSWPMDGIPINPTGWLYSVAKNKAKNYLHRQNLYQQKIVPVIQKENIQDEQLDINLSPQHIQDSVLQMMFTVCHPSLTAEVQIGLALRILCGFSIEEIANAFLTNKEVITKRLFRGREKLRDERIGIEFPPPAEIRSRLEPVMRTIYLLFNEGYYSITEDQTIRKDLCYEAIRLCQLLIENEETNQPAANALMALMCFHASRLDARMADDGELILYDDQDTNRWNQDLISKGGYFLHAAAKGDQLSRYHLEAGIAYWNSQLEETPQKWEHILQLYDQLLLIDHSPIIVLNRTYALFRLGNRDEAIEAVEKLSMETNYLYFALLGEMFWDRDKERSRKYWKRALSLVKSRATKLQIEKRMAAV